MSPDEAETIAIRALGWLVANDDLLPVFLGASGAAAEDLRSSAQDPAFLAAVLDFVTMNDDWVIGFCDAARLSYDLPLRARHALPGAAEVHWT